MAPRPILKPLPEFKRLSSSFANALPFPGCHPSMPTPHVHFPPTPAIASTQITHSSAHYDRAPIVVSPNSCALPERGDRTYMNTSPDSICHASRRVPMGSYFHPLAFEACEREPLDVPNASDTPALIPDISSSSCSESDDSDGYGSPILSSPIPSILSPPSILSSPHAPYHSSPCAHPHSQSELNHALSFLPYPPSSPNKDQFDGTPKPLLRRKSFCRQRSCHGSSERDTPGLKEYDAFKEPQLEGCLGGF